MVNRMMAGPNASTTPAPLSASQSFAASKGLREPGTLRPTHTAYTASEPAMKSAGTMPAKKTMDRQGSGREAPHAVPAPAASRRLPRMSTMARLLAKARARAAT
jgi:hypothetical protein